MDKKSVSYLIIAGAVAIMAGVTILAISFKSSMWRVVDTSIVRRTVSAEDDRTFQNDVYNIKISVPKGWYVHERFDGLAILNKKERIAIPQGTEIWAAGEQISIVVRELMTTDGKEVTIAQWVDENVPDKDADDEPVTKSWEEINGHRMLRVEMAAAGTANRVLTYYAFNDQDIFVFSLYPHDPSAGPLLSNLVDFQKLVNSVFFLEKSS